MCCDREYLWACYLTLLPEWLILERPQYSEVFLIHTHFLSPFLYCFSRKLALCRDCRNFFVLSCLFVFPILTEDLYLWYLLRGYSFELSLKRLPSERGKHSRMIQCSLPFCLTRICFYITLKFVAQREQQPVQLFMLSN